MAYVLRDEAGERVITRATKIVLKSKDGQRKASPGTVLSSSWTDKQRAAFNVFPAPKAKTGDAKLTAVAETLTKTQRVQKMLDQFGLTLDDLKEVLAS